MTRRSTTAALLLALALVAGACGVDLDEGSTGTPRPDGSTGTTSGTTGPGKQVGERREERCLHAGAGPVGT